MQGKIGVTKKLDIKFESKIKLEEFLDHGYSFDPFLLQCTCFLKHLYSPWIFEAIGFFYFFNVGWSLKHTSNFLIWINAWIMCSLWSPLNLRHLTQSNIYGFSMWVETFVTSWTFEAISFLIFSMWIVPCEIIERKV